MEAIEPVRSYSAGGASTAGRPVSAVAWGAIFAGSLVATSVSLILFAIGSGLGFSAMSPWQGDGMSLATSGVMAAVWLVIMQWIAAGIGGFITGRMRVRWIGTHAHEVFFRDTAHGFVTWSLSTLLVAALAFSGTSALIGGAAKAGVGAASSAAQAAAKAAENNPVAPYGIDTLFRPEHPGAGSGAGKSGGENAGDARGETVRILMNGLSTGQVPDADRTYLAQLVAAQTGVDENAAQKRVDDFIAQAKATELKAREAADKARKAAAETALLTALSLLVGAFIASVASVLGGHHRDQHP